MLVESFLETLLMIGLVPIEYGIANTIVPLPPEYATPVITVVDDKSSNVCCPPPPPPPNPFIPIVQESAILNGSGIPTPAT
jgi:hypothetical protein